MSRQIFEVTINLADGSVLKGRGRNLPATVERIYKEGQGERPPHRVLMERVDAKDAGYPGTYNLFFGKARQVAGVSEGIVKVAVSGPR